ncbi:hypothetical protein [Porcincola intestinalis]|uniref:Uncharacterized protein n=1 Tax=Porcincola intestinalis TaxID=2606632 RepID=A0A6L5X980_9FIRM|nr:hypothetical protein [Porcincola intestinalis]MSS15576.1 hypothetical protein [Porcincola intestinalis]
MNKEPGKSAKAEAEITIKVDGQDVKMDYTGNMAGLLCAAMGIIQSVADKTGKNPEYILAAMLETEVMGGVKDTTTAQGKE